MEAGTEAPEAMQARHRKEQRDLQSRITSKKKNATKKTRKGVNEECAELERQLKEKQEQELVVLNGDSVEDEVPEETEEPETDDASRGNATIAATEKLRDISISDGPGDSQNGTPQKEEQAQGGKKRNRQQERMARRKAEQEAAAEAAENEASNMTDHRAIEKTYLLKVFKANNLVEKEIQPDGHCLFSAIADQLSQQQIPLGGEQGQLPYKIVRRRATDHMERHKDDFAPFLEDDFEDYVRKIRDTAEWGGQLELKALADAYGVEIKVVQDGRTETIEPTGKDQSKDTSRIWVAYYRHGYGLGEHYNSLRGSS